MRTHDELVKEFDEYLAPYAIKNAGKHGREYKEAFHSAKLPFQRDRDRIIHSKACRRLKHKTQVLVSPKDDHVRDRLTHSIEGAQIVRGLCRSLRLNEDLAEAAILAHDLGHPPFGHEGEHALHEMMQEFGLEFDHNEHSYRIVTELEQNYPDFPGLNLTAETRAAIQKHHVPWEMDSAKPPHKASLEAQLVNLADEIAYYSHDIDDGLRSNILKVDELLQLEIGQLALEVIRYRYTKLDKNSPVFQPQLVRSVLHLLSKDITEYTASRISSLNISSLDDIYALNKPVANYSPAIQEATLELRKYLYKNFYHSQEVSAFTHEGKQLLKELFTRLYDEPRLLPEDQQALIDNPQPKAIVIKDYIAGMTDNFATDLVKSLRKKLI